MNIIIEHSARGSQRPNHKYVSRKWKNGKWQYYYKDSKVKQYQSDVDYYQNQVNDLEKKAKLADISAKGYTQKWAKKATSYIKNPVSNQATKFEGTLAKSGVKYAKSAYYNDQLKKAKKNLSKSQAALYTEARNEARKVMADPRYQKQLQKNINKIKKEKAKNKKKLERSLKRIAFKYKTKRAVNKAITRGRTKVKHIINEIKRRRNRKK